MLQTFTCKLFSDSQCDKLVEHFNTQSAIVNAGTNVNSQYDGRVLNADDCVEDVRDLLYSKAIKVATSIAKLYGEDAVYPETIHIVSWGKGTSLGTHADNFFIDQGIPNYSPNRNFSATFILTEDFEGGNFYFEENGQKHLMPSRKGWGTVFGAGPDYPHGVTEVTEGHRYTVAIWFTSELAHSVYKRPQVLARSSESKGQFGSNSVTIPFVIPQ